MSIGMILRNTVLILRQIHVCGAEAGMLDGALKNLEAVIAAIEKAEKEGKDHDHHDEQREDV